MVSTYLQKKLRLPTTLPHPNSQTPPPPLHKKENSIPWVGKIVWGGSIAGTTIFLSCGF